MPWSIYDYTDERKGYIRIADDAGNIVADIFPFGAAGGIGRDLAQENARKIVNADQLYDALNGLMDWVKEGCPEGGRYALVEAEAAIKSIRVCSPTQRGNP